MREGFPERKSDSREDSNGVRKKNKIAADPTGSA